MGIIRKVFKNEEATKKTLSFQFRIDSASLNNNHSKIKIQDIYFMNLLNILNYTSFI